MSLQDWFYQYFIEPMVTGSGFNPVNTAVYAIAFILVANFTFNTLRRFKIKIDEKLVSAILPFILFGISVRVLEDAGILKGFWFITPGIWILFFSITFSALLVSYFLQKKKKIPYFKTMFIVGSVLFLPTLAFIRLTNIEAIGYVLLWFLPLAMIINFVKWSKENKIITAVHGFDGVVTFVAVNYFGYIELHVLPRFVINLTGTAFSFLILKLLVVVPVLMLIDKYSDDKEFKNFIKLAIAILGFVPGVRDFLSLIQLI